MKVREDEGLNAGLFGRFLIVGVEVVRAARAEQRMTQWSVWGMVGDASDDVA